MISIIGDLLEAQASGQLNVMQGAIEELLYLGYLTNFNLSEPGNKDGVAIGALIILSLNSNAFRQNAESIGYVQPAVIDIIVLKLMIFFPKDVMKFIF